MVLKTKVQDVDYFPSELLVEEFQEAVGRNVPHFATKPDDKTFEMCINCIKEELEEVIKAHTGEPMENYFKELCDLQYVVDQLFVMSGLHYDKEAGVLLVHNSNLSKLDDNGKPVLREDGKIMKGPNYKPVDMKFLKDMIDA